MARGRFARSQRRQLDWLGFASIARVGITTTQSILSSFSFTEATTVVRIRGNLLVSAVPDAALDDEVVGLGIAVVSDAAAAVGGTSVPGPIANGSFSFLWHTYVPLISLAATAASDVGIGLQKDIVIDSKAMRKMKTSDTLALIAELSTGEMQSVFVQGGWRTLQMMG